MQFMCKLTVSNASKTANIIKWWHFTYCHIT